MRTLIKFRYRIAENHPLIYKTFAKFTDWKGASDCDVLFFPGGAQLMKYAPIKKEYIYYTDACFNQMVDYYWHNLNDRFVRLANRDERWAIQNASINIRSSEWARDCAVKYYKGNPNKNYVLEFGANLDTSDICDSQEFSGKSLNVLFSGVEWERKGGDIAVEVVRILRDKYGVDAKLYIAGIKELPERYECLEYVISVGFLNKNILEEYNKYVDLIKNSHILLLPTKAECSGIVFCEASAYGLPIFTHDTGGIGNYVINGVNGYRLKIGSTAKDFADKIYEYIDCGMLPRLHDSAKKLYSDRLNWKSWSQRFREIVNSNLGIFS